MASGNGTSGRRDKFVTVERRTDVAKPGFPTETWTRLREIWMERSDAGGDERFIAAQGADQAAVTATWKLPYAPDMDPDLVDVPATRRLVYSGRTYDIRSAARVTLDTVVLVTIAGSTVQ